MISPSLESRRDAPDAIAGLFSNNSGSTDSELLLQVQEDKCFPDLWLTIGHISIHPEPPHANPGDHSPHACLSRAIRFGSFEWRIPEKKNLTEKLVHAFATAKPLTTKQRHKLDEAIKEVAHIAIRCGLAHPALDPLSISNIPLTRPVSIVVDTSAVIQGGLDFAARYLAPQARIKVPAIVHMEILNLVDRYFRQRHQGKPSPSMLFDHAMSQGAHRALLRLAMDPRTEIERSRLGPDPLRGVVQPDSDAEDKSLGLQVVQRSFADRLILETAIQHRNSVSPDHDVTLLTSDQGLARMALAEGIQPMFCDANAVTEIFGSTRTGVVFAPFLKDGTRLSHCSLADILWESATSFGSARLLSEQSKATFTVSALQSKAPWQLHHSIEDLLWTATNTPPHAGVVGPTPLSEQTPPPTPRTPTAEPSDKPSGASPGSIVPAQSRPVTQTRTQSKPRRRQGSYSFKVSSMTDLIQILEQQDLSDDQAMSSIKVKSKSTYGEYYNFLVAGGLAQRVQRTLSGTPALSILLDSMRSFDYLAIGKALEQVPSFYIFIQSLRQGEGLDQAASGLRKDAFRTYAALAELACVGVRIQGQAVYGTPNNPIPAQFVPPAISAFDAVRRGERFALAGAWLEHLAANDGIHPVHVRQRLAEAHQGGYLHRFFEGSTPETRFQTRSICCLHAEAGAIGVRIANLYFGDFLYPGRASVSIRLSAGATT